MMMCDRTMRLALQMWCLMRPPPRISMPVLLECTDCLFNVTTSVKHQSTFSAFTIQLRSSIFIRIHLRTSPTIRVHHHLFLSVPSPFRTSPPSITIYPHLSKPPTHSKAQLTTTYLSLIPINHNSPNHPQNAHLNHPQPTQITHPSHHLLQCPASRRLP